MAGFLRVKNWEKFQHYKDRNPPWIKLHSSILKDYDFLRLPDASKAQLLCLWVLASENHNKIPHDEVYLRRRLGVNSKLCLKLLIEKGFLIPFGASSAQAKSKTPLAPLDRERERERETLTPTPSPSKKRKGKGVGFLLPAWIPKEPWEAFLEMRKNNRRPMTDKAKELAVKKLETLRSRGSDPRLVLEESVLRGWQGLFAVEQAPKSVKDYDDKHRCFGEGCTKLISTHRNMCQECSNKLRERETRVQRPSPAQP